MPVVKFLVCAVAVWDEACIQSHSVALPLNYSSCFEQFLRLQHPPEIGRDQWRRAQLLRV